MLYHRTGRVAGTFLSLGLIADSLGTAHCWSRSNRGMFHFFNEDGLLAWDGHFHEACL
jgi:hypothetical protein